MLESTPQDSSVPLSAKNKGLKLDSLSEVGNTRLNTPKLANKEELWCTYCKKSRHSKDNCWKLYGKPRSREWGPKWKHPRQTQGQTHMIKQEENQNVGGFSPVEIEKLKNLLESLEKPEAAKEVVP